jgi:N-acetylmuramoyl-L-alanine amidase.
MGEQQKMRFLKPKREVNIVFIHCSASDNANHDNVETIKQWHKERGFNDIGYHYYINKKGMMFMGRDIEKTPAAQEGYNTGSIAICLGGLNKFTLEQFQSLKDLCREINKAYGGNITFHGHCEVSSKLCPNFEYRKVLSLFDKGQALRERGFMKLD